MKSSKLIELLKRIDPSGETEVCFHNHDIAEIFRSPAYYDGSLQVIEYEKAGECEGRYFCGTPTAAKMIATGDKIQIYARSIQDLLSWDYPELPVEFVGYLPCEGLEYRKRDIERWRQEGRDFNLEVAPST